MNDVTTAEPLSEVVIVGGAGAMGRWAVRAIARLGSTSRLVIADIDLARARQIADEVGPPCVAERLDATDPVALRTCFAGADVVLNTMGPFSRFAGPVLDAAISSGCDYLDIDDDWESTLDAFEHDARAREQGLRIVKGIGGSPGISNLMALLVSRRLDKVSDVLTGWSMRGAVLQEEADYPASAGAAGAAVEHWLIQVSGSIRAWRDGAERDVAPLETAEFDYPGLGSVRAYTVGHPEAVTLPRYLAGVTFAGNYTSGPAWVFEHARSVAAEFDAGRVTLAEGASRLNNPERPADAVTGRRDPLGQVWAVVRGERQGDAVSISMEPAAMPPGKMGGGTGVALAVGLELLRQGRITATGVHAPEGAIEPEAFFDVFRRFVEPAAPSVDDLLVIHEAV